MRSSRWARCILLVGGLVTAAGGCGPSPQALRLSKENQDLRAENERLARDLAQREEAIAVFEKQVEELAGFTPDRPLHKFAPVSLEIASLSGGADYDGKPGDDGVTLYLRPKDADGDVVKVPGRIKVQLVDNTNIGSPRVVGVCVYDDIEKVRAQWQGKFLTQHFSVKCPFPPGARLPESRKLLASAEFVDLTTGATLTASQEVTFEMTRP